MALHLIAMVCYGTMWKKEGEKAEHIANSDDDSTSSSSTFRFTHSLWMVIWFACCCLLHRSPNKWEMCVMNERFPSCELLLRRFMYDSTRRRCGRLPACIALCAGLYFYFHSIFERDAAKKVRMRECEKFYLWLERRKKVERIMQSVILLFIKDSHYDVIYVRWKNGIVKRRLWNWLTAEWGSWRGS